MRARRYWLFKSEPSTFSIDDLNAAPKRTEHWDGVRNYQARNMMRDEMRSGDLGFFYHSSCVDPGIVGIVEIVREGYPDHTALDPANAHYDPKSSPENPRWYMVDVCLRKKLKRTITLAQLKQHRQLRSMPLLKRGNRLSITPVAAEQWEFILALENVRSPA